MTKTEVWVFVLGIVVMLLMSSGYFFKKKSIYLTMQSAGIVVMCVSYLLEGAYFAMVGLGIGLVRSLVYLWYECKDKDAPLWWAFLFSAAGIACYCVINLGIMKDVKPLDILYLIGLAFYAFIFRIRDFNLVRYWVLIPTALSIVYNAAMGISMLFVTISYSVELCANLVSIVKTKWIDKRKKEKTKDGEDSSVDSVG